MFAGHNTVEGLIGEIDEEVRVLKKVVNEWKERNNDTREEVLEFETNEGGSVRVLRVWVSTTVLVRM